MTDDFKSYFLMSNTADMFNILGAPKMDALGKHIKNVGLPHTYGVRKAVTDYKEDSYHNLRLAQKLSSTASHGLAILDQEALAVASLLVDTVPNRSIKDDFGAATANLHSRVHVLLSSLDDHAGFPDLSREDRNTVNIFVGKMADTLNSVIEFVSASGQLPEGIESVVKGGLTVAENIPDHADQGINAFFVQSYNALAMMVGENTFLSIDKTSGHIRINPAAPQSSDVRISGGKIIGRTH